MSSIGNDIIALKIIDVSRTRTPQFYNKILAATELQLYDHHFAAIPFEYFVWLLWSIKESAYKCLQRHQPGLVFTPVKMVVSHLSIPIQTAAPFAEKLDRTGFNDDDAIKSITSFSSQTVYARSVIYGDELIHTVACPYPDFSNINWGIKKITQTDPESQSAAVREFLLNKIMSVFPDGDLSVKKSASGYPLVMLNGKDTRLAVSLSHHGEWVGYSVMFI